MARGKEDWAWVADKAHTADTVPFLPVSEGGLLCYSHTVCSHT